MFKRVGPPCTHAFLKRRRRLLTPLPSAFDSCPGLQKKVNGVVALRQKVGGPKFFSTTVKSEKSHSSEKALLKGTL